MFNKYSVAVIYCINKIRRVNIFSIRSRANFLLVVLISSIVMALPFLQPTNAGAVQVYSSMTGVDQIKSFFYLKTIQECFMAGDSLSAIDRIPASYGLGGAWFSDKIPDVAIGTMMTGSNSTGMTQCSGSLVTDALSFWDLDAREALCNSNFNTGTIKTSRQNGGFGNTGVDDCMNSDLNVNDYFVPDLQEVDAAHQGFRKEAVAFGDYIQKKVYGANNATWDGLEDWQKYLFYLKTLDNSCLPGIYSSGPTNKGYSTNDYLYGGIKWVDPNTRKMSDNDSMKGALESNYKVNLYSGGIISSNLTYQPTAVKKTCANVVTEMNKYAQAYADYLQALYNSDPANYANNLKKIDDAIQSLGITSTSSSTACSITGVGWIICPIARFLASITDTAFKFISKYFLEIKPTTFTETKNNVHTAWGNMRNIANVAFVLAFLIIIFMQITGIDKSSYGANYGVKRLLPRLIIAAILVNISYYICQIMVDLSNILGFSFDTTLSKLVQQSSPQEVAGLWSGNNYWTNLAGTIVGGVGVLTLAWLYIASFIPLIFMAVVALVTIFFILVARQALVILLVVISPLAFVAYLLPNTEGLYKKWQKMFISMLMVFPIVGLLFGASKLASAILFQAFASFPDDKGNIMGQLVAACTLVLPLFAAPSLLRRSLDSVGNIGAMINGLGNNLSGRASTFGKGVGDRLDTRMNNAAMNNPRWFNPRSHLMRFRARRDMVDQNQKSELELGRAGYIASNPRTFGRSLQERMAAGGGANADLRADAKVATLQSDLDKKEITAHETLMKSRNLSNNQIQDEFETAVRAGDSNRARAAQNLLLSKGGPGKSNLQESYHRLEHELFGPNANENMRSVLKNDLANAGLMGSNATLARFGFENNTTMADLTSPAGWKDVYSGLTTEELAGQRYQNMILAAHSGAITHDMAAAVLSNDNARNKLTTQSRQLLKTIQAGGPLPPPIP